MPSGGRRRRILFWMHDYTKDRTNSEKIATELYVSILKKTAVIIRQYEIGDRELVFNLYEIWKRHHWEYILNYEYTDNIFPYPVLVFRDCYYAFKVCSCLSVHLFYYRSFSFIDSLEGKSTAGNSDNTAGNLAEQVCWAGSEV